jgi:UDP-glucose 4-epimerase
MACPPSFPTFDRPSAWDPFTIYGDDYPTADGTGVRDYIHVTDLADAHVKALSALLAGAENTVLNLGTGRGWSVRELVAAVREVTGCEFPVQVGARRPGDPPALVADASRARGQLGWRPQYADLASQVTHARAWRQGGCRTWKRMRTLGIGTGLTSARHGGIGPLGQRGQFAA